MLLFVHWAYCVCLCKHVLIMFVYFCGLVSTFWWCVCARMYAWLCVCYFGVCVWVCACIDNCLCKWWRELYHSPRFRCQLVTFLQTKQLVNDHVFFCSLWQASWEKRGDKQCRTATTPLASSALCRGPFCCTAIITTSACPPSCSTSSTRYTYQHASQGSSGTVRESRWAPWAPCP